LAWLTSLDWILSGRRVVARPHSACIADPPLLVGDRASVLVDDWAILPWKGRPGLSRVRRRLRGRPLENYPVTGGRLGCRPPPRATGPRCARC
jgi:hypothetical protein